MRVLVADKLEQTGLDGLRSLGCQVQADPGLKDASLVEAMGTFDPEVLIVRSTKAPAAAIDAGESLKLIVRAGSGVDNIDVPAASARDIAVCNCPGMNAVAVAELTIGLLIACDRRIPDQTSDLRAGTWRKKEYGKARGLKGSTLGVVGVGAIGEEVIRRAKAFDLRVVAWSRSLTAARAKELGVEFGGNSRRDLLAMLPECDAVTVHVALSDDTRGLCDAEFFGKLKPGAYFINTARGGVVDAGALRAAVEQRGLRCGLDVFCDQPGPNDEAFADAIVGSPGVYGTHHCGASTDQAQLAVADEAVRIVKVFKETGRFENRVNTGAVTTATRGSAPATKG